MRATAAAAGLLGLLGLGCPAGGGSRTIAARPGDVPSAGGSPSIKRITDLGAVRLPDVGPLPRPDSDGVFTIGELVLVEGSSFGRQPALRIAGRPARILSRLTNGGIVARIPAAVPTGTQPVTLTTSDGSAKREISITRYALVVSGGGLEVVTVTDQTAAATGRRVTLPGARFVRYSADGSTAYVATTAQRATQGRLTMVAMGAAGGPKVAGGIGVAPHQPIALATAERTPLCAVVGDREISFLATELPHAPSPYRPWALPHEATIGPVVGAELSPDGRLLALLLGDQNRLMSIDISDLASPRVVTTVELLPGARAPLVRTMQFSPDGETLWIVSGDNPQSLKVARYPTRVTAVKLTASPDGATPTQVAVWRSSEVSGAGAPLGLAVARGQLLDSGTTVRIPPEKAGVFLTAAPSDALEQRLPEKPAGQLIVTNVEGAGAPLGPPDAWVGPLDLSPDTRLLLATAARPAGGGFELGVVAAPLGPNAKPPRFVALGTAPAGLAPPLGLGELRIQP